MDSPQPAFPNQIIVRHELKPIVEGGIDRPDFFMMSGIAMKLDANKVKVCGHTQLFTFDL